MTPEEFAQKVKELASNRRVIDGRVQDPEDFHGFTDILMEDILTQLGYGEGIALIRAETRWYA